MKTLFAATAAVSLLAAPAVATSSSSTASKTITEIAVGSDDFDTLEAAVIAAGLAETLGGEGPYTVFAPTDAAFEALPAGTVETLVKPENKAQLTNILTYHVVAGEFTAADVVAAIEAGNGSASLPTVNGSFITAAAYDGKVYLSDYQGNAIGVLNTDVKAANGVIHVIDGVLLP